MWGAHLVLQSSDWREETVMDNWIKIKLNKFIWINNKYIVYHTSLFLIIKMCLIH